MNVVLPPKNNSADQWTGYNLVLLWYLIALRLKDVSYFLKMNLFSSKVKQHQLTAKLSTLLVSWLSIVNLQTCHSLNVNINRRSSNVVRNNKPFLKTSNLLSLQPFMSEWNNNFYLKHQIIISKDYLLSALLA